VITAHLLSTRQNDADLQYALDVVKVDEYAANGHGAAVVGVGVA